MNQNQYVAFFADVQKSLPLPIERIEFSNDINLNFGGEKWDFNTTCAWRLTSEGSFVTASGRSSADKEIQVILGKRIVGVSSQSFVVPIDPCFHLDNRMLLEVFSDDTFEPWVMHLPDPPVYVSTPD